MNNFDFMTGIRLPPLEALQDIETKFIPELVSRINKGLNGFTAVVESIDSTLNIVICNNGRYVQEFAIGSDINGLYWLPVVRVG